MIEVIAVFGREALEWMKEHCPEDEEQLRSSFRYGWYGFKDGQLLSYKFSKQGDATAFKLKFGL